MKDHTSNDENGSRWSIVRSIDRRTFLIAFLVFVVSTAPVVAAASLVDGFEDGDISEYDGDTGGFEVTENSTSSTQGNFYLEATSAIGASISSTSGLSNYPDTSSRTTADVYVDSSYSGFSTFFFGTTAEGTMRDFGGYGVFFNWDNDYVSLISTSEGEGNRNVLDEDGSVALSKGEWVSVDVRWIGDYIKVILRDEQGDELTTLSATDDTYGSGGIGFQAESGGKFDNVTTENVETQTPTVDNSSVEPSGGKLVQESPVELRINVSDADFGAIQPDEVEVAFYDGQDNQLGTDTISANATATAEYPNPTGGANEWYVEATDSYGNTVTSETFTFNAPSELEIRALDTQDLITTDANGDPINVEVQFFGDDGAVAQRNTTNGIISLTNLPVDERFSVSVDAGETYVDRRILITSLIEHQTAYLLNASDTELVRPRFTLEDPSNQFDTEESEIILERPIETANGTRFVPVTGDRIGLNGFDTTLEEGQRYRVIVRDPDSGSVRRLGEYTPTASEQVTLTVQDVEFDSVSDVNGLEWGASYETVESGADEIQFIYRDQQDTVELEYQIYERGNESNVLASGNANGNVTVAETVPPGESGTVWAVEWSATRANGETLSASRVVSSNELPVGGFLPTEWQTAFSVVTLFVVAGLFGGVNPGVGGIAVASTGGFFFLINWLPGRTTGLMVLLAFFLAVLSYAARQARGATA